MSGWPHFWRVPKDAAWAVGGHIANAGLVLAARVAERRGVALPSRRSLGARRLADWLMAMRRRQWGFDGELSGETIDRVLTGEIDPGDAACETIARITESEVLPEHFALFELDRMDGVSREDAKDNRRGGEYIRFSVPRASGGFHHFRLSEADAADVMLQLAQGFAARETADTS